MNRLILFICLLFLSFNSFAYTPKAEIDPKNQKWNWTFIYALTENNTEFQFFTDLTKREQLSKGRYIFPIETRSTRGVVRYWHLADCNSMKTSNLGVFVEASLYRWEAGLAVFDEPQLENDNSVAGLVTKMMCSITTSEAKKVFGYVNMRGIFLGWYPDDVLKVSSDENNYEMISIHYNIFDGHIDNQWLKEKATVNCSEQSVENNESKQKFYVSNPGELHHLTYLIESICEYGKNGLLPDGNIGPAIRLKNAKSDSKSQNVSNSKDIKIAKEKCLALGFKEKTEKFGSCVLELTK